MQSNEESGVLIFLFKSCIKNRIFLRLNGNCGENQMAIACGFCFGRRIKNEYAEENWVNFSKGFLIVSLILDFLIKES